VTANEECIHDASLYSFALRVSLQTCRTKLDQANCTENICTMLIVRSPVRISFAGGGTDLPTPGIGAKARAKSPGEWKPPHRAGAMKHKCPGLIQLDILEILSVTGLQLLKNRSHSLSPDRVPVPVHKLPFAHKSYAESLLLQHLTPSPSRPIRSTLYPASLYPVREGR
jgi:hypothetical protein